MMLNHKKSNGKSWLKLLALLPILGVFMALNAETVTNYVYQEPQKKLMKKGKKAGKVNVSGKTIEVKADTAATAPINIRIIDNSNPAVEPLVIIDGQHASMEELKALDPKTIDHIDVLKDKAAIDLYGEEGKNGVINITTKNAVSSGDNTATGTFSTEDGKDTEFIRNVAIGSVEPEAFDVVEKMPEYPGGMEAMMTYLSQNIHYPEAAYKAGKFGRVLVSFIIEPDGSITNANVVKKVHDDLDAEAVRVVNSMPKWTPGMQDGKAVRVKFTLPITFRLN